MQGSVITGDVSTNRLLPLLIPLLLLLVPAPVPAVAAPAHIPVELVPARKGPGGRALLLWDVNQSWPGDGEYDPRLDRPVRFWRTAASLTEVFQELQRQTGAEFGIWPEGDEDARTRVNLYLNEKTPPTLRAVMVQLAWTVDRTFAFTTSAGEQSDAMYYLLGGRGQGSSAALLDPRQPVEPRPGEDIEDLSRRTSQYWDTAVREKLAELEEALTLPREVAVARYLGQDDQMLLTLLDPHRRAAARLACRLLRSLPSPEALVSAKHWDEMSEEEQTLMREAFPLDETRLTDYFLHVLGSPQVSIQAGPVVVREEVLPPRGEGPPERAVSVTYEKGATTWFALLDLREGAILPPADILALGRLLGDSIPQDQEASYIWQYRTAAEEAQLRKEMEAPAGTPQPVLSAQKTAQLSSLSFDAGARLYALWEVQAQVARATGWNIVSDCFWQGPRQLTEATSLLDALVQSCTGEPGRLPGLSGGARFRTLPWAVAWEWGDAGSFLRFRSVARGLWHASLLPTRVLTEADQYLDPYWRQAMKVHGAEGDLPSSEFQEAVTQLIRIARRLDDVQLEYGGHLLYEDPTTDEGTWRHEVREAFFWLAAQNPDVFRLMLSFDDAQWQLLSGPEGMQATRLMATQGLQLQRAVRREGEFLAPDDYPTLRIRTVGILPTNAYPGFRISPGDAPLRLELLRGTGSEADRRPWIVWRWSQRIWAYPHRPDYLDSRSPAADTSP